jgi:hypothetical protein
MHRDDPGSAAGTPARLPVAPGIRRQDAVFVAAIFALVLMACAIGSLVIAVPGTWFPLTAAKAWTAKALHLVRGAGRIIDADLVVATPDVNDVTLVSIITDLQALRYRGVAWTIEGLPQNAQIRLLWRSDVRPERLNSVPVPWSGLAEAYFMFANWHLLFYGALGVTVLARRRLLSPELAPLTLIVAAGLAFLVFGFAFTNARQWVEDQSTVNRATLHLAPLITLWMVLAFRAWAAARAMTDAAYRPVHTAKA